MLLRRFADRAEKLSMASRHNLADVKATTVSRACRAKGFYRIDLQDVDPVAREGHDPETVEKILSVYEGRADAAITTALAEPSQLSAQDRYELVMFTAFQFSRGWQFRNDMNQIGTLAMRQELRAHGSELRERARQSLRERNEPSDDHAVGAFIEEAIGSHGPTMQISQPHAVQQSLRLSVEVLGPLLSDRTLTVLRFEQSASPLLISDSPVSSWSPDQTGRQLGPAEADLITMPISRYAAFVFGRTGTSGVRTGTAGQADAINTQTAAAAERWIYHHPDDHPLAGLKIPSEPAVWVERLLAREVDEFGLVREQWIREQRWT